MKLGILYGAMPNYDFKLSKALRIISETLNELAVETDIVNLSFESLSFYDGDSFPAVEKLLGRISSADGVVLMCSAAFGNVSGIMQCFIEHMAALRPDILRGKNCVVAVTSSDGSETVACEYLSRLVARLGGYEAVRFGIGAQYISSLETNAETRLIIERQIEDFYRIVRQGRKMFTPSPVSAGYQRKNKRRRKPAQFEPLNPPLETEITGKLLPAEPQVNVKTEEPQEDRHENEELVNTDGSELLISESSPDIVSLLEKADALEKAIASEKASVLERSASETVAVKPQKTATKLRQDVLDVMNFSNLSEGDEEQIKEISDYLAKKMAGEKAKPLSAQKNDTAPKLPTCKAMTLSLPHYFQPKEAGGINSVFQIIVSGEEEFSMYISVVNTECSLTEGEAESSDIIILADAKSWMEILKGKVSCQKAFMIGRIKVRGNFVMLSKLDKLFLFMMS